MRGDRYQYMRGARARTKNRERHIQRIPSYIHLGSGLIPTEIQVPTSTAKVVKPSDLLFGKNTIDKTNCGQAET